MGDVLGAVPVEALLAVVAVAAGGVVAAVAAHASARVAGQLVQLHVQVTLVGVQVTVTRCENQPKKKRKHLV